MALYSFHSALLWPGSIALVTIKRIPCHNGTRKISERETKRENKKIRVCRCVCVSLAGGRGEEATCMWGTLCCGDDTPLFKPVWLDITLPQFWYIHPSCSWLKPDQSFPHTRSSLTFKLEEINQYRIIMKVFLSQGSWHHWWKYHLSLLSSLNSAHSNYRRESICIQKCICVLWLLVRLSHCKCIQVSLDKV